MPKFVIMAIAVGLIVAAPVVSETVSDATDAGIDKTTMSRLKEYLYDYLNDPDSALLRTLEQVSYKNDSGSPVVGLCGRINVKNKLGGYIGFRRFIFVIVGDNPKPIFYSLNSTSYSDIRDGSISSDLAEMDIDVFKAMTTACPRTLDGYFPHEDN